MPPTAPLRMFFLLHGTIDESSPPAPRIRIPPQYPTRINPLRTVPCVEVPGLHHSPNPGTHKGSQVLIATCGPTASLLCLLAHTHSTAQHSTAQCGQHIDIAEVQLLNAGFALAHTCIFWCARSSWEVLHRIPCQECYRSQSMVLQAPLQLEGTLDLHIIHIATYAQPWEGTHK